MGFFKKVFRPIRKVAKKIIPKEIRPFLPYAAAMIPGAQGLASLNKFMTPVFQKALLAGATSAATDEQGNPLRAAALAAAPDVLSKGLGAVGTKLGVPGGVDVEGTMTFAERIGEGARSAQGAIGRTSPLKIAAAQTAIDSAAKFAEIRQDEIDQYNKNLLEQGVASKVDRRKAIFGIYKNAGYDDDYVNTMLDTYGYADGGRIGYANGGYRGRAEEALANARSINDVMPAFFKKRPKKKTEIVKVEGEDEDEEGNKKSTTFNINIPKNESSNLAGGLMAAMDGVQKAYGRSFGEMEPVPMMRFARGGEVEIEEQTEDLGIMDLMRDQGVEYGEQVSNAQNDELLEKLFEEFLDLGFSPEDAAKKAREAFDDMSQGQGIKGTQVASGYKDDIEELYEQYVFEMEEQGLQPMDFASYLRQARSGMAKGGIMNKNLLNTGMDKDMRGGGFIPEGTKEKEDDVPARLSKNEFVMTADAVRAAGGGSVNEGAKRMYETMHKLEAKV